MYSTVTDAVGNYSLELPISETYILQFERNIDYTEGVSFRDVLAIYKHILGITDDFSTEQQIAADINNNGGISTFDMVVINQLMFGIDNVDVQSWNFYTHYYLVLLDGRCCTALAMVLYISIVVLSLSLKYEKICTIHPLASECD